ncbi:hypothetical protein ACFQ9X_00800 [Catenulispora yoronensis]
MVGFVLWRAAGAARRGMKGRASSVLITIAALMATAVQSAGMWKFFANTMALPLGLRIFLFSFMEVALLACGTRAKENVRAGQDAGIDGVLVVVLALGSGVLASTDASTWQEVLIRLMVSIVAALLWERDLLATKYAARQDGKKPESIRWRFGWKTLAVRWGWADAGDASLADQGANRVFDQFVRATHTVNRLEQGSKQHRRAADRQAVAQAKLMSYARLNTDLTQLMRTLGEVATTEGLTMLGVEAEPSGFGAPAVGDASVETLVADTDWEQPRVSNGYAAEQLNLPASFSPAFSVPAPRVAEPQLNGWEGMAAESMAAEPPVPMPMSVPMPVPVAAQVTDQNGALAPTEPGEPYAEPTPTEAWPTAADVNGGAQTLDHRSARLARQIVGQWPDDSRVTQRAFLAEFRKHKPISNKDGAALHRYAVESIEPEESG